MNILCSIDDTEVSKKTIKFALKLAEKTGAKLNFIHVSPVTNDDLEGAGALNAVILKEVDASNHNIFSNAEDLVRESSFTNIQYATIQGHDFAEAIVDYAETNGCDHIIAGSTGRVGIPRLILGSVASDIIHKAHCPVTIVR